MPPTLFSHTNPDLDSVFSRMVVGIFIKRFKFMFIELKDANWDGNGMRPEDLAVDMTAGGKGNKGKRDADGKIHSSFELLVREHAPKEVQEIIRPLVEAVDGQDSGSPITQLIPNISKEAEDIFGMTGVGQVFRSIQTMCRYICYGNITDDENAESVFNEMVYQKMKIIFQGFLKGGHKEKYLRLPLAILIDKFAKKYPEDEDALAPLLEFRKLHLDIYKHYAPEITEQVREIFYQSGIVGIYGAIRAVCNGDEKKIEEKMFLIFEGMRLNGITRKTNEAIAEEAKYFADGKIAVTRNLPRGSLHFVLKKIRILVYINGKIIGIKRGSDEKTLRMDHPEMLKLITAHGEEKSWYAHPNGYKCAHGGSRNPPTEYSSVTIEELLAVAMKILAEEEKESTQEK